MEASKKDTAILIDGGFLANTFMDKFSTGTDKAHLAASGVIKNAQKICQKERIFRIYYYDCTPYSGKQKHPVSGEIIDYYHKGTPIMGFQKELARSEQIAFRRGLLMFEGWKFAKRFSVFNFIRDLQSTIQDMMKGIKVDPDKIPTFSDTDIVPSFKQKRVDIKIGLDIAWLAIKGIVGRLIVVTGDSDFIPVMKFARKEGVQVVLCSISKNLRKEMFEHCDEFIELNLVR